MNRNAVVPLTKRQKAAILLVAIGPEAVAKLFKHMRDDDVEGLTLDVARLGKVTPEQRRATIAEFHEMCIAQDVISEGGIEQARKALEAAYGTERANEVVNRVVQALQVLPFDFVKKTDPSQLLSFIQERLPAPGSEVGNREVKMKLAIVGRRNSGTRRWSKGLER